MHKLIFIPVLWFTIGLCAQSDRDTMFVKQAVVTAGNINNFSVDNLGNLYVLNAAGFLKKMNANGDSLNVFNDVRRYGGISTIDVTNPLKLLLYFRDFSTVVMLDRFLNQINTIDLRKTGIFQAKAIGLSYDNNLWIYDEQAAKLKKLDDEGKVIMETVDLRQILTIQPSPHQLIDRDGFVYLYDKTKGLLVFDYYGMLKNELPITGIENFQVIGNTVVGISNGNFIRYALGNIHIQEAPLPLFIQKPDLKVISSGGIYVYKDQQITRYAF